MQLNYKVLVFTHLYAMSVCIMTQTINLSSNDYEFLIICYHRWRPQPVSFNDIYYPPMKKDCIPVECIPPACWPYLPVCTAQGGCLLPGGACSGGCGIPVCIEADPSPPPWTEFLTHATENITLLQTSFVGGNYKKVMFSLMSVSLYRTSALTPPYTASAPNCYRRQHQICTSLLQIFHNSCLCYLVIRFHLTELIIRKLVYLVCLRIQDW